MSDPQGGEALSPEEQQLAALDIQGLRRIITIGMDVTAFMRSNAGQYLKARCNADMEVAMEKLASTNPFDGKEMAAAQIEYQVPARVLSYLANIEDEGSAAEAQFIAADAAASGT